MSENAKYKLFINMNIAINTLGIKCKYSLKPCLTCFGFFIVRFYKEKVFVLVSLLTQNQYLKECRYSTINVIKIVIQK